MKLKNTYHLPYFHSIPEAKNYMMAAVINTPTFPILPEVFWRW